MGFFAVYPLPVIDFPFQNETFSTFQESTSGFSDPENIGKGLLHGVIHVFISSNSSPK